MQNPATRKVCVPKAAWRRVAVTPPGRPTRRPGDATAYMTLTPWEPLQLRSPGAATADMTVEYEYEYDDQIVCAEVEKSLIEKKIEKKEGKP